MNTRGMHPDVRAMIDKAERAGFTVTITGGGHILVRDQKGRAVATMSKTPSSYRGMLNARAALRRAMRSG